MKTIMKLKKLPKDICYDEISSPVGRLTLLASSQGLHCILWEDQSNTELCRNFLKQLNRNPQHQWLTKTKAQLTEYFQGNRRTFDLPLCYQGTAFQKQAWHVLRDIPYGKTLSYGEQAQRVGDKNKARAVGLANGANPIPVIIPCHRVIGSNGKLTGFGGGIEKKALLLALEQKNN